MTKVKHWLAIECPHPECTGKFYRAKDLKRHSIIVHGAKKVLHRGEIDDAIKCGNWGRLRIMMKGLTTQDKVHLLQSYYVGRAGSTICCTQSTRYIQVVNYLNALARGGQIEALSLEEHAFLELEEEIRVRIRK